MRIDCPTCGETVIFRREGEPDAVICAGHAEVSVDALARYARQLALVRPVGREAVERHWDTVWGRQQLSIGERITSDWWGGPEPSLEDLARRIDEDRATLACPTHRACMRAPGDCCAIGSVIGYWDKQYEAEAHRAEEAEAAVARLSREAADGRSQGVSDTSL